jgi:hypothetical protein
MRAAQRSPETSHAHSHHAKSLFRSNKSDKTAEKTPNQAFYEFTSVVFYVDDEAEHADPLLYRAVTVAFKGRPALENNADAPAHLKVVYNYVTRSGEKRPSREDTDASLTALERMIDISVAAAA